MTAVSHKEHLPFPPIPCQIQYFRNKTQVKFTSDTFSGIMILLTFISMSSEFWSILNTIRISLISDDGWHEDPRYALISNRVSCCHISWKIIRMIRYNELISFEGYTHWETQRTFFRWWWISDRSSMIGNCARRRFEDNVFDNLIYWPCISVK